MATKSSTNHSRDITIVLCVLAAIVLAGGLIWYFVAKSQQNHYFVGNEPKVIELYHSTGPVSPEYQESVSLVITPTSCTITKTTGTNPTPQITNCTMTDQAWGAIHQAYVDDSVEQDMKNAKDPASLGGPETKLTVTLANGQQQQATFSPQQVEQVNSFIKQVQTQIPQVQSVKYVN